MEAVTPHEEMVTHQAVGASALDLDRCRAGMKQITVEGATTGPVRSAAIEFAIRAIQRDPAAALVGEYVGVKNYASFGDQREDCTYGCGPRHGSIVFRIARVSRAPRSPLTSDAIYLLEAVRDFGSIEERENDPLRKPGNSHPAALNLCDVLARADWYATVHDHYLRSLADARVESHAEARP